MIIEMHRHQMYTLYCMIVLWFTPFVCVTGSHMVWPFSFPTHPHLHPHTNTHTPLSVCEVSNV